jgi:hypothetical protein
MAKKSIAELEQNVGYLDRDGIGYRKVRATAVLAESSNFIKKKQDPVLNQVLRTLREENFDMDRLEEDDLELIYAAFDEKMTTEVCGEFYFHASMGNIRDLGKCEGHCDLCGKGDSRDDGENEDKLRYQFRLTNNAGGDDVWVGSTCIIQHGLHVDGAANAEQAKEILKKTLQEHLQMWKIQAWQEDNPDHETIPELWNQFRLMHYKTYPVEFWAVFGFDMWTDLINPSRRMLKPFRTASRFYERTGYLPDNRNTKSGKSKMDAWVDVKKFHRSYSHLLPMFREAMKKVTGYGWRRDTTAAVQYLEGRKAEMDARAAEAKAAAKRKRKPRRKSA